MSWTLTHPSFTMTGPDPAPVFSTSTGGTPPVEPPPVIPPPEEYSNAPYPFGPPIRAAYDYERTSWAWQIPGRQDDDPSARMYAMNQSAGNPAGTSHGNALIVSGGAQAGQRLFAPFNAPPHYIREVIATSRIRIV